MKKLLLGLLISVTLLSTMVGCASSKEVNGKQIEVVMEKKEYDVSDCGSISDYLNQQLSKNERMVYGVGYVEDEKNTFYITLDVFGFDYGHDKETVEFINQYLNTIKELEIAFKGANFDYFDINDGIGGRIAHYDNKTEKMVLDIK